MLSEYDEHDSDTQTDSGMRCDVFDLLDCMLQWEPSKRITAQQALSHPFFTRTAVTSELTEWSELLHSFDQVRAEQSKPSVSTNELLQQPFTIHNVFSRCPLYSSMQLYQQHTGIGDTTAT